MFMSSNCTLLIPFALQMSPREMVHDLLQFSLEAPECRHRTCLSIRLNGKKIDSFIELGNVEGLKSGCTIELVEGECYPSF